MKLAESFNEFEDVFIVDSMPLEICKEEKIMELLHQIMEFVINF